MTYLRLTAIERKDIERLIRHGQSVHAIALKLQRSPSTIAREIKRNRTQTKSRASFNKKYPDNNCKHVANCEKHHLCHDCNGTIDACRLCIRCNAFCDDYEPVYCKRRDQSPGCCNGCDDRRKCHLVKYDYLAKEAQAISEKTLRESRVGISLTDDEIQSINVLVSPLLKKGQSVHHIYMSHRDELPIGEKTLYAYIDAGLLEADLFDLPRKLGRKPSRKRPEKRVDKQCYLNRTFDDFITYRELAPGVPVVEMDCVEGPKGSSKVLLTLKWQQSGVLMAFLLRRQTSAEVTKVFKQLQEVMGEECFQRFFPLILTDRGSEFTNPRAIEEIDGKQVTRVFYCDPQKPQQKPHVENEHILLRRKLPKGTSFDDFTQDDINEVLSNTNSYKRAVKNEKAPLEIFTFTYGKDALEYFPLRLIPPDDVDMKPYKKK